MCVLSKPKMPKQRTPLAAYDNGQAQQQADIEARLRRRRAGAAADILTGATGIPATATMGGVAQ